ncbi:MAG TPA: hypothetical protein VHR45_06425 [Thermoanaerobaculia bacterium]|nr:hypothetical protein [Thermoanaerobaculia bacterium]
MHHERRIARYIALVVGGLLCAAGVLHDIVNIPSYRRALARGEIAERMGPQLVVNVALAGLALALMGVLLVLIAPELGKGRRTAWLIGNVIGSFLVFVGVGAYLWLPRAGVLMFSVLGGLLCGPLLVWRKEFLVE